MAHLTVGFVDRYEDPCARRPNILENITYDPYIHPRESVRTVCRYAVTPRRAVFVRGDMMVPMRAPVAMFGMAVLLTLPLFSQVETIAPEWVVVTTPLIRTSPPTNTGLRIRSSPATLLVFYPSGKYAAMSCLLIQQKDGGVTISNGDSHVVRIGRWGQNANGIVAFSIEVSPTISISGDTQPEPTLVEEFSVRQVKGKRQLRVGPQRFTPLAQFADFAKLAALIPREEAPRPEPAASVTVPDAVSAVAVAEKALSRVYGKVHVTGERPFYARLSNGIWTVGGTIYCKGRDGRLTTDSCAGGAAVAEIRQSDGKVLRIVHYR